MAHEHHHPCGMSNTTHRDIVLLSAIIKPESASTSATGAPAQTSAERENKNSTGLPHIARTIFSAMNEGIIVGAGRICLTPPCLNLFSTLN